MRASRTVTRTDPFALIVLTEVEALADQGLSINQVARACKYKSDAGLRQFLKNHPELEQKLMANGLKRKTRQCG